MGENVNGVKGFETLRAFLEEDGWYPRQSETDTIFHVNYRGKSRRFRCEARLRVEAEKFIFYADAPGTVPEKKRMLVAEYIMLVNYGLRIGNMEMSMSKGYVRYKSSLDFKGAELTRTWIKNAIWAAVTTMDIYLPGLLVIVKDNKSAAEALAEIKNKQMQQMPPTKGTD